MDSEIVCVSITYKLIPGSIMLWATVMPFDQSIFTFARTDTAYTSIVASFCFEEADLCFILSSRLE